MPSFLWAWSSRAIRACRAASPPRTTKVLLRASELAWSPGATEGWLAKLTGGPGNTSIRAGFGLFYNPIEQLVLEQFSAEPPFGGSSFVSDPQFNLPYLSQSGAQTPNPFTGVINQTPQTPCAVDPGGPPGCVDWSNFRSSIYFGEFQPNLKSQYAEQYNLTIERQLTKDMLLRVSYVGTQAHHLLASYDLNYGHAETCLGLNNLPAGSVLSFPGGPTSHAGTPPCGPFGSDSEYFIQPGTVIPTYTAALRELRRLRAAVSHCPTTRRRAAARAFRRERRSVPTVSRSSVCASIRRQIVSP